MAATSTTMTAKSIKERDDGSLEMPNGHVLLHEDFDPISSPISHFNGIVAQDTCPDDEDDTVFTRKTNHRVPTKAEYTSSGVDLSMAFHQLDRRPTYTTPKSSPTKNIMTLDSTPRNSITRIPLEDISPIRNTNISPSKPSKIIPSLNLDQPTRLQLEGLNDVKPWSKEVGNSVFSADALSTNTTFEEINLFSNEIFDDEVPEEVVDFALSDQVVPRRPRAAAKQAQERNIQIFNDDCQNLNMDPRADGVVVDRLDHPRKRRRKTNLEEAVAQMAEEFKNEMSSSLDLVDLIEKSQEAEHKAKSMELSSEQKRILDMVVREGKSVFFTGAAGTGKSVLLRFIIKELRRKYENRRQAITDAADTGRKRVKVAVTASTGLAACHIEGVTLHSFAGIGLGKEPTETLVKKIRKNKKIRERWRQVKVLVVDEISMVDGALFDKLDEIARIMRRSSLPFGGIQLVITGDFYQLPPVPDKNGNASFVFDAKGWGEAVPNTIELRQVFRQRDNTFANMLNELRHGVVTEKSERILKGCARPLELTGKHITATELFPRKADVERANLARLQQLNTPSRTYDSIDWRHELHPHVNFDNLMCVQKLTINVGAQVMMVKNLDDTLVNGSIGTVVGFMSESSFVLFDDLRVAHLGVEKLTQKVDDFNQKVVQVAAMAQLDEESQSCTESIYGPRPRAGEKATAARRRKHATVDKLRNNSQYLGDMYPLVRYSLPNGTFRMHLTKPEEFIIEDYEGRAIGKRIQVPLILAWALSIHKAQGQTLPYVRVDLNRAFETGQSYVALSRAVSLTGLQVIGFSQEKVTVDPRVVEFYDNLSKVDVDEKDEDNKRATKADGRITSYMR